MGLFKRLRRGITLLRTLDRIAVAMERIANRVAPEGVEIVFDPDWTPTDDFALYEREQKRAAYELQIGRRLSEDEEVPESIFPRPKGH